MSPECVCVGRQMHVGTYLTVIADAIKNKTLLKEIRCLRDLLKCTGEHIITL